MSETYYCGATDTKIVGDICTECNRFDCAMTADEYLDMHIQLLTK